jgi:HlyD family secretion protein
LANCGTVEAVVSVDVSSQLSGRIAEMFVNFNDSVTAGQPIAQIDQEIFSARVNEAGAALRVANAAAQVEKAALERAKVAPRKNKKPRRPAKANEVVCSNEIGVGISAACGWR